MSIEGGVRFGLGSFCIGEYGGRVLKEYQMQVGRASVKLEFSEEAEAGLKERVKAMIEKAFQNRIEEEFMKFEEVCSAN